MNPEPLAEPVAAVALDHGQAGGASAVCLALRAGGETRVLRFEAGRETGGVRSALAEAAAALPAGTLCVVEDAGCFAALVRGADGCGEWGFDTVDIQDIASIVCPAKHVCSAEAAAEALGVDLRPGGADPAGFLLAVMDRAEELCHDVPLPVLDLGLRLLRGARHSGLRSFLARAKDEAVGRVPAVRRMQLESLFRENIQQRPRRREEPGGKPVDPDAVASLLEAGGECSRLLAGYERREQQVAVAKAVASAFNNRRRLLLEAGTGTGKTIAYLLPAARYAVENKAPVIVSTSTRNLQSQLIGHDLPLVRRILGVPFEAALIKGRTNYLCVRKLLRAAAGGEMEADERLAFVSVAAWAASSATGDVAECPALSWRAGTGLLGDVTCPGDECLGFNCPHLHRCFLWRARAKALGADVVVANHSLLFAESGLGDKSPALPPHRHVILDEAHNIEEAATRHFSTEVSLPRLHFLTRRVKHGRGRRTRGLVSAVRNALQSGAFGEQARTDPASLKGLDGLDKSAASLELAAPLFFSALAEAMPAGKGDPLRLRPGDRLLGDLSPASDAAFRLDTALRAVAGAAGALAASLRAACEGRLPLHAELCHELSAVSAGMNQFADDLAFVLDAEAADFVFWLEKCAPRQGGARAMAAPIDVGERLKKSLYAEKDTIVFCSATLTVAGSTAFMRRRLGLEDGEEGKTEELCVGSPFDFVNQCRIGVPVFLPEPGAGGDYADALACFLSDLFERTNGRALGLFTSYDMLRRVGAQLRENLAGKGIGVLAQGESGSREHLLERLRNGNRLVLLGTHSFWEGIDVVGEALSCLVVARLPFAVVTDPVTEARCERIREEGRDPFNTYTLPNAVIRLRQGFGRLIRHRGDRGIVVIADRRVLSKPYGVWFRRSLPAPVVPFNDPAALLDAAGGFLGGPD